VSELLLRTHRLPPWGAMYLYAAYRLGASQEDVHAAASLTTGKIGTGRKLACLEFALSRGAHLTNIGALDPQQYLEPQALSYLTHIWDAMDVDYTEQLANATLYSLQFEMVGFLELIANYSSQYHHETRPAAPDDALSAFSQGATAGIDIWRGKLANAKILLLGTEGDDWYESYVPSTDLVHYNLKDEINTNMWPTMTILGPAPLQL